MRAARRQRGGKHRAARVGPTPGGRGWWPVPVAVVLIAVGLSTCGWLAWEYVGSTVVAHHRQRELVTDLHEQWRSSGGDGRPGVGDSDGSGDVVTGPWGTAFAIVRIPAFGPDYAVPVLRGTGDEQFATGFGQFPDSADPGERGNLVLGAHRITHGEPLRDLPDLDPGDEVIVETREATYVYELDSNSLEVSSSESWPVASPLAVPVGAADLAPVGPATITLITCASLFHTDERSVAFGHLAEVERSR
ncbi:sortase domain-containing protein [Nocardioides humilatus]|uniref:sortase domain-containing protein n=1 Tax=Nocardioides humilatus TaxID=2607660 RepID=UPI00165F052F|nr:sortase [Nocardioides humilatus]